jgi:membrane fusion protein, copper/silver efflux system
LKDGDHATSFIDEDWSNWMMKSRTLATLCIVAVAVAGSIAVAHYSGWLNPVYHRIGWHNLMQMAKEPTSGNLSASSAHAGHSGMDMPELGGPGMSPADSAQPSGLPGYSTVTIDSERQQLIGVRIGEVKRDKLQMSIRAVGIIEPDQTRLARIQTRINGWVTRLYVDYVGQAVKKGDPLLELFSPELLTTQQEYLIARGRQQINTGTGSLDLAGAALRRLTLSGVSPEEIAELQRTGEPRDTLILRSPIEGRVLERNVFEGSFVEPAEELYEIADLSVVWLQAKIYEFELPHIEIGQPVIVTIASQPNDPFPGKVTFVEPVVQEATRTVKVRVEIDNQQERLKPGMYADLMIEHDMGEGLLIPESAVLRTGERAICFRSLPEGRFEPVEVKLGGRFGDNYEILSGLQDGEKIVVSAGFLIDSESRLKATTSGSAGGHKHGG